MIDYLGYNLTEYKSFRQLQLEYIKTKNQNQTLQSRLESLSQSYEQKCRQLIQLKNEDLQQKLKLKNKNLKYKKLYRQLIENIETNLAIVSNVKRQNSQQRQSPNKSIDKSIFAHLQETENLQKICSKLSNMTKEYISLKDNNLSLQRKLQTIDDHYQSESVEKEQGQLMIFKQVQYLEAQLEELHQTNVQLQAKTNIKDRERRKIQSQLREIKKEYTQTEQRVNQLEKEKQQQTQQDSQFSLDFMTFQLQLIQSFFNRVAESATCSSQLSTMLAILYTDYEELSQIFREKLQIEYDLQQLQQGYKMQKSSPSADDNLLIQTRRQIETFRLELLRQKEIFRQKEQHVEEHFEEYVKINNAQMKVRNYTYEVENRLYKQKRSQIQTCERTRNPTARDILAKRNQNSRTVKDFIKGDIDEETADKEETHGVGKKTTSLKFKQSNNVEELMKEIIKKDKHNLQTILKDTRRSSIPMYKGN